MSITERDLLESLAYAMFFSDLRILRSGGCAYVVTGRDTMELGPINVRPITSKFVAHQANCSWMPVPADEISVPWELWDLVSIGTARGTAQRRKGGDDGPLRGTNGLDDGGHADFVGRSDEAKALEPAIAAGLCSLRQSPSWLVLLAGQRRAGRSGTGHEHDIAPCAGFSLHSRRRCPLSLPDLQRISQAHGRPA